MASIELTGEVFDDTVTSNDIVFVDFWAERADRAATSRRSSRRRPRPTRTSCSARSTPRPSRRSPVLPASRSLRSWPSARACSSLAAGRPARRAAARAAHQRGKTLDMTEVHADRRAEGRRHRGRGADGATTKAPFVREDVRGPSCLWCLSGCDARRRRTTPRSSARAAPAEEPPRGLALRRPGRTTASATTTVRRAPSCALRAAPVRRARPSPLPPPLRDRPPDDGSSRRRRARRTTARGPVSSSSSASPADGRQAAGCRPCASIWVTSPHCDEVCRVTTTRRQQRGGRPSGAGTPCARLGGSTCTTSAMSSTWMPRAATSVATSTFALAAAERLEVPPAAFCARLPCRSTAGTPARVRSRAASWHRAWCA